MKSELEIVNEVVEEVLRLAQRHNLHLGGENRVLSFLSSIKDIEGNRKRRAYVRNLKRRAK